MSAKIKSKFFFDQSVHKRTKPNHSCIRRVINSCNVPLAAGGKLLEARKSVFEKSLETPRQDLTAALFTATEVIQQQQPRHRERLEAPILGAVRRIEDLNRRATGAALVEAVQPIRARIVKHKEFARAYKD